MVIVCPACKARYRIDPAASKTRTAKVKCPECKNVFEVLLAPEQTVQPQPGPSGQPLVLVVDDARFFREMIKDILKDLPVELAMAADGNEAWQKITKLVPQLVLLDLNIPGKDGREILRSLQESPQLSRVKVLAMSGVERGEATASAMRFIGADDFISKSFRPRELQDRVRKILDL